MAAGQAERVCRVLCGGHPETKKGQRREDGLPQNGLSSTTSRLTSSGVITLSQHTGVKALDEDPVSFV